LASDKDGDGKGEPVLVNKKPNVGKTYPIVTPAESDEFNTSDLGLQWQWQANPKATWAFMNTAKGTIRLYSAKIPDDAKNLWNVPNILMQKFPAEEFNVITKITFTPNAKLENEKVGFVVMGLSYAALTLKSTKEGIQLLHTVCKNADNGNPETENVLTKLEGSTVYFRVAVAKGGICSFSYSTDGKKFIKAGDPFTAEPGKWIGAKVGLYCTRTEQTNDSGFADVDWFRVESLK
jgi:beta-xylosidase